VETSRPFLQLETFLNDADVERSSQQLLHKYLGIVHKFWTFVENDAFVENDVVGHVDFEQVALYFVQDQVSLMAEDWVEAVEAEVDMENGLQVILS
jgi:hypothetical protein